MLEFYLLARFFIGFKQGINEVFAKQIPHRQLEIKIRIEQINRRVDFRHTQ